MSDETTSTDLVPSSQDRLPAARTISSGSLVRAFVPQNFGEAMTIARVIAKSRMSPKSYDNDEAKILVGMMTGAECGLTPMQSLRGVAMIGNMPSLWGDVALGLVVSSGLVEDMVESQDGDFDDLNKGDGRAVCTIKRIGRATPVIRRFGMLEARRTGLLTKAGPWAQGNRERMCQMRARAFALRDLFADVLSGLHVEGAPEEHRELTLTEQAAFARDATVTATVDDLEHQSRGLAAPAAVMATDELQRAAEEVQEQAATNLAPEVEQQPEQAPKRRVRTPKPPADPLAKKKATDQTIAEMMTLRAMHDDYERQGNMQLAGNVKTSIIEMRERYDFSELDAHEKAKREQEREVGDPGPQPDLAPGVAEILTETGYDLNTGEIHEEGTLKEAVRELRSKELLPDVTGFAPAGLTEDEQMEFESIKAKHVQGMIEEAKQRRR